MEYSTIETIKNTYPAEISKDQLYRICHISKKTASFLLESGLIPNRNSGKKTRKYTILLSDVLEYLQNREENIMVYKAPENYYKGNYGNKEKIPVSYLIKLTDDQREKIRALYYEQLKKYKDVLTVEEVIKFIGYSSRSIHEWLLNQELKGFLIYNRYKIPKEYLVDFLVSDRFLSIPKKSVVHKRQLNKIMAKL